MTDCPSTRTRESNNRYWGVLKQVTQQGIKLVLVTQPAYLGNQRWVTAPYANQSNLDTAVNRIGAAGILAFEGPNEVDNNNGNWGGIPAYGANTKAYMAAMYAHAKAIAPSVTVIGLTTTSSYGSSFIGDISSYMDAGTLHPYPGGVLPTSALNSTIRNSSVLNAQNKPWWVTETGYYTSPNATVSVYQPGISEAAQGKYVDRIYLDYFSAGISHTSVYEIIDEHVDLNNAEANYGLMRNDGTPKPRLQRAQEPPRAPRGSGRELRRGLAQLLAVGRHVDDPPEPLPEARWALLPGALERRADVRHAGQA